MQQLFQKLKLIEAEFPDKEHIFIEDAVDFIRNIVKTDVEKKYIKEYLKQKGYKKIEEKPKKTKPFFVDDEDFDLDDFLEKATGPEVNSTPAPKNRRTSFTSNLELINTYQKSRDENVYAQIVEQNLRLVHKEAGKLQNWMKHKLTYDDLVQEGMFGLFKAVEKFDSSLGNQFSTYATWWIRQAIFRAICDKGHIVRIPVHMIEQVNKMRKVERQSLQDKDEIDVRYICEELQITVERYDYLKLIESNYFKISSLNGIVSEEDGDTELLEFMSNDHVEVLGIGMGSYMDPHEKAVQNETSDKIWNSLKYLTDREREVIIQRFGLIDGTEKTLEQIGKIFGVTRERIRQIEAKALKSLRRRIKRKDFV
ncbi:sigma-70 family RNA polymerase sigma factor [Metabacillus idriensis]|uniref:sigma-70 family RNA polymerase sigma factor n=1 Tax=Metabacillus idriensis TaxID=324768 RepID=UPI003D290289